MASLTLTVAASTDDAYLDGNGGFFLDNVPLLWGASGGTSANYGQGARFLNVTLAAADTVTSAKLKLMKEGDNWNTIDWRLTAIDEDNTLGFSGGSPPGARAIVSASIAAEAVNLNHLNGVVYDFPTTAPLQDTLGAAIEAVINRAGWASGNALAIVCNSDQDASAVTGFGRESYEDWDSSVASSEPQLVITYTAAGVLGPITYFGSASAPADNGTQAGPGALAVTPPASMVAGDLVVMVAAYKADPITITMSATGGQEWFTETAFPTSGITGRLFWCRYNGTWAADPSVTNTSGTLALSLVMHVFRPPDASWSWGRDAAQAIGTFSAPSTPFTVTITGRTTIQKDTVTLASWVTSDDNSWTSLAGTGWVVTGTAQYRNLQGNDLSATFAHYIATAMATAAPNVSKNQTTVTGDAGATSLITFYAVPKPPWQPVPNLGRVPAY